jgi:hypothetical protein
MLLLFVALVVITVGPFAVAWLVSQRRYVAALGLREPTSLRDAHQRFSKLGDAYDRPQADPALEQLRRTHNGRFIVLVVVLCTAPLFWLLVGRALALLGVEMPEDGSVDGALALDLLIGAVAIAITGFWASELVRTRRGRGRFPLAAAILGIGAALAAGAILLGARLT